MSTLEKKPETTTPPTAVKIPSAVDPTSFSVDPAHVGEISAAALFGACSGYATKKLAKTGGLIVGLGFMSIQALVYADILKVNWPKIEKWTVSRLDADGDGKLTHKDFQFGAGRFVHLLTTDMPSAAGFTAAFWIGFRYG
ncbi:hypothetical protein HK098_006833 [Nowakowskiella sp. JEL0407]|nr:hypothetical protein HK098_006833 [Nowakowskiella sp. JEL0407]